MILKKEWEIMEASKRFLDIEKEFGYVPTEKLNPSTRYIIHMYPVEDTLDPDKPDSIPGVYNTATDAMIADTEAWSNPESGVPNDLQAGLDAMKAKINAMEWPSLGQIVIQGLVDGLISLPGLGINWVELLGEFFRGRAGIGTM